MKGCRRGNASTGNGSKHTKSPTIRIHPACSLHHLVPLASPVNADDVWVNKKSGRYWKPGSPYYRKTKQGEYMSEKEAVQKRVPTGERYRRMIMAVNHKLTKVVTDRVVQNFQLNASILLINFVDGSKMTVTIVECNSPPLQEGARIRQISEDQTKLLFECEDESTLDVTIVDPGNSVIVRDKNGQVEYLG
jgi:hypothetical protein